MGRRKTAPPTTGDIVKAALRSPPEPQEPEPPGFIPTGSTLLNLALSNDLNGGWPLGKFVNLIGDSSSGKTFLALTAFAEMARDVRFNDYRFIYDDAEAANEFDLANLFGSAAAERIEPPATGEDGEGIHSETTQDFQAHLHAALADGRPFLYILDSFDALTSDEEVAKVAAQIKARGTDKKVPGTYGMEKAKAASQLFRMVKADLRSTASCLIVISQTRDNIDPMSFEPKTRAGGRALKFYATHELWTAVEGKLKKTVKGKAYDAGVKTLVKITKNKITGKHSRIGFPIQYHYGIDDCASMLDWLVGHEVARKAKGGIEVAGEVGSREALIVKMDSEPSFLRRVRRTVGKTWEEIDQALKTDRRKYA